jgi:ubiquinone biosynthesis monooxygenase Coq7
MANRRFNLSDRLLMEFDHALRVVAAKPRAARAVPTADTTEDKSQADENALSAQDRELGARLMRVNHSGEIAAQALYRGQAAVAGDEQLRAKLLVAAAEEHDHLAWCQQRAEQLGGRVSLLAPFWYAGSFAIGAAAGLAGDKISLSFLAETERQVTSHLNSHLEQLSTTDAASRAILEQMREDEIQHGDNATRDGGEELPTGVKKAMGIMSKVMTTVSFRV